MYVYIVTCNFQEVISEQRSAKKSNKQKDFGFQTNRNNQKQLLLLFLKSKP